MVKAVIKALTTRIEMGESSLAALEHRVSTMEELQDAHAEALIDQHLHLEDMKDWSCRNNLRLRGLIKEKKGASKCRMKTFNIPKQD